MKLDIKTVGLIVSILLGIITTEATLLWLCNKDKDALILNKQALSLSNLNLLDSIKDQNIKIENMRIDYEDRIRVYEESIPFVIPTDGVDIKRSNCEDVSNILNNIRNIDF
jgi:hypothetical protein